MVLTQASRDVPAASKPQGGVLVVDDDAAVRELITMSLELAGLQVRHAADGMEALHLVGEYGPDLVILDLMMPGVGGLEVLERIRNRSAVPVIVCSALASDDNVVIALQRGADDFVAKPFSPDVLAARVQALLRRAKAPQSSGVMVFQGLMIDVPRRQVTLDGTVVETTAKEFDLLAHLARSPGRVFTRHELLRDVWKSSSEWQQEGTVTEHVRRLRLKLESDPERPQWLQTVRGVGYKFERRHDR